jgi:hypothetical protein
MLPAASVLGCNSPALLWPTESRPSSNLASSCVLPPISSRSRNAGILNRPHTGRRSCVDKTTKNVAKARGEKPSTGEHHQVAWPRRTGLEQFAGGWKERAPGVLRSGLGSDVRSDESRVSFRSDALTGGFDPVPRRHPCIAAAGPFATVVKIPNGKRLGYVEHFDTGEFDAAQNPVPILMFASILRRNPTGSGPKDTQNMAHAADFQARRTRRWDSARQPASTLAEAEPRKSSRHASDARSFREAIRHRRREMRSSRRVNGRRRRCELPRLPHSHRARRNEADCPRLLRGPTA